MTAPRLPGLRPGVVAPRPPSAFRPTVDPRRPTLLPGGGIIGRREGPPMIPPGQARGTCPQGFERMRDGTCRKTGKTAPPIPGAKPPPKSKPPPSGPGRALPATVEETAADIVAATGSTTSGSIVAAGPGTALGPVPGGSMLPGGGGAGDEALPLPEIAEELQAQVTDAAATAQDAAASAEGWSTNKKLVVFGGVASAIGLGVWLLRRRK